MFEGNVFRSPAYPEARAFASASAPACPGLVDTIAEGPTGPVRIPQLSHSSEHVSQWHRLFWVGHVLLLLSSLKAKPQVLKLL